MVWYGMEKQKEIICKRCKDEVSTFYYNYNGGLCNSCKIKRGIYFGLALFFIGFLISIPFVLINFNYGIDKCSNLNSKESNYDFSETIELNAQYNERCYYLNNHPLALPSYFMMGAVISGIFAMLGWAYGLFSQPRGFKKIKESWSNW